MLSDKRATHNVASGGPPVSDHADPDDTADGNAASTSHHHGFPDHHGFPAFVAPGHAPEPGAGPVATSEENALRFDGDPAVFPGFPSHDGGTGAILAGGGQPPDHGGPEHPGGLVGTVTGTMDEMSWSYSAASGLRLDVAAGHLVNGPGDGGFTLDVRADGHWLLHFDGTDLKIGAGSHAGWMEHGSSAALNQPPGAPPLGNVDVVLDTPQTYDGSAGQQNIFGDPGRDIFVGGPNDYMDGGGGLNCAAYTGPDAVLIDLQHGHGYGGPAQGNSYVDMQQARGSAEGSVLIGSSEGSDLKSGGADSVLISTGGTGPNAVGVTDELRPDGPNCLLVSTVGADNVVFDPTHGWRLGDAETMLGFNAAHGDDLNLTAAVQNWVAGESNIADYVKLVDESDGTHVLFDPSGHVATSGAELIDLKLDHGLDLHQLYATHNIVI